MASFSDDEDDYYADYGEYVSPSETFMERCARLNGFKKPSRSERKRIRAEEQSKYMEIDDSYGLASGGTYGTNEDIGFQFTSDMFNQLMAEIGNDEDGEDYISGQDLDDSFWKGSNYMAGLAEQLGEEFILRPDVATVLDNAAEDDDLFESMWPSEGNSWELPDEEGNNAADLIEPLITPVIEVTKESPPEVVKEAAKGLYSPIMEVVFTVADIKALPVDVVAATLQIPKAAANVVIATQYAIEPGEYEAAEKSAFMKQFRRNAGKAASEVKRANSFLARFSGRGAKARKSLAQRAVVAIFYAACRDTLRNFGVRPEEVRADWLEEAVRMNASEAASVYRAAIHGRMSKAAGIRAS